jgi:Flp pilus assembly protein TadG
MDETTNHTTNLTARVSFVCDTRTARATFARDSRGSIAVLSAFALMVLALMTGLAVDTGRILMARTALAGASDAAGLAVGRALMDGVAEADAVTIGEAYFAENARPVVRAGAAVPLPAIVTDGDRQTVTVTASTDVPVSLMRVAGFTSVRVPVTSEVRFATKDIEIGVAIDVTGSMGQSIGASRKIDALKAAFESFVRQMIPEEPLPGRRVRIGVAPYAAAINLGPYAAAASGSRSRDGCVTERLTRSYDDHPPGADTAFAVEADGTRDVDPTQGRHGYGCTRATVLPLSADREAIVRHVQGFSVGGTTGGHFGTQWAWNLVAEDYRAFWGAGAAPDPYARVREAKLVKAVILMTDGVYNVAYRHGRSREQAVALCDAMKAKGVVVLSVAFGLGEDAEARTAKATLQACASPGPQSFADAADAQQLDAAFKQFASLLGRLRVSR